MAMLAAGFLYIGLIMQVAAASRREEGGCATDPASTLHVPFTLNWPYTLDS